MYLFGGCFFFLLLLCNSFHFPAKHKGWCLFTLQGVKVVYPNTLFVCVSVSVLSSHLLFWTSDYTFRYVSWTHQPGSRKRNAAQDCYFFLSPPFFCVACLSFLSREGFSRPFPSSAAKSNVVCLCSPPPPPPPLFGLRI